MATRNTVGTSLLAVIVLLFASPVFADDPSAPHRGFVGGAALVSVQPERFALRRDLRGAPDETKPVAFLFGGITLTRRLAVQGEVSASGRFEKNDRDDSRNDRIQWRDGLASAVVRWRVASVGPVAFEPVGGLTVAFARSVRNSNRDDDDDHRDRTNVDVTRGGVVAGVDIGVAVARHVSVVPTLRVHRIARRNRDDDETPGLRDGANIYRFGVGARWVF